MLYIPVVVNIQRRGKRNSKFKLQAQWRTTHPSYPSRTSSTFVRCGETASGRQRKVKRCLVPCSPNRYLINTDFSPDEFLIPFLPPHSSRSVGAHAFLPFLNESPSLHYPSVYSFMAPRVWQPDDPLPGDDPSDLSQQLCRKVQDLKFTVPLHYSPQDGGLVIYPQ